MEQLFKICNEMIRLEELEIERNKRKIKSQLKQMGVLSSECRYCKLQLLEKWKENFSGILGDSERLDCNIDQYLWHIFTYGLVNNYIEGEQALEKFDSKEKNRIYLFWQGKEEIYFLENAHEIKSEFLRFEFGTDLYITDEEFKWILIFKHSDWLPIWYEK